MADATGETGVLAASKHKPDPKRVGSHCRVDCSCGWRGPQVALFGHGTLPWTDHFKEAQR